MSMVDIFLLIGVAHWAVHLVECKECRGTLWLNTVFLLQALHCVLGWPLALPTYLAPFFRKVSGPSSSDVERIVDQVLKEHAEKGSGKYHGVLIITQKEGESEEAFQTRAMDEMAAHAENIQRARNEEDGK